MNTRAEWVNLHPVLDFNKHDPVWCRTQNAQGRFGYVQHRLPDSNGDTTGALSFAINVVDSFGEPFLQPGDQIVDFLVRVEGAFGGAQHMRLPSAMPQARLITLDPHGNVARVVAEASDTSSDVQTYDRGHSFYSPGGFSFAWSGREHVMLQVLGESGHDALAGALALHRVAVKIRRPLPPVGVAS